MQSKIVIRKENKMYSTRNSEVALKKNQKKNSRSKGKEKIFRSESCKSIKSKKNNRSWRA